MTKNKNNNLNKTSGKTPGNNRSMIWLKLVRNRTLAFTIGSVLTLSSISAGLINLSRFTQTASAANAITVNNGYGCGTYNNPNSSNMSFSTGDTNAPSSPQGYSTNCVIDGQIGLPLVFTGVAVESFSATAPTGTFTFDPDGTGPVAGIPGTLSVDTMAPGTFKFTSTDPLTVTTNNVVSNLATLAGPTGGGFTTATNVIAKVNGSSSFSSSSSSSSISSSSMSSSSNSSLSSSSMSSDSSSSMSSSSSLSSSSSSSVSSSSMSSSSSLSSSSNSNNNNSSSVSAVVNSSSNSSVLSSGNSSVLNSSNSNVSGGNSSVSGGNSNSTGNSSNSNVSGGNSSNSSSQAPTVPVPANFDPNGDPDGDGIKNSLECPTYNVLTTCADTDGDGIGNFADSDNDGDGIPDAIEARNNLGQPVSPMMVTAPFDTDGDSIPDFIDSDSDNDGISDKNEKGSSCISLFSCTPIDTDGNGVPDYRQIGSNTNSSNSNSNSNGNSVNSNSTGNSVNSTNNSANNSNSTGNSSNSAGVVITQVPVNPATFNPTNDSDGDGIKDGIECPTYSAGYCNSSTPSGVPDFLNNNFPYNTTNSATNSSAKSIITVTGGQFDPNADSDGDGVKNGVECATYASGKCPDSTGTGVADYLNPNYPFKVFYNSSANNSAGNSNSTGNSTNSAGNSTGNSTNSANNSNNSNSLQGLITVNINPNTFDANGDNDGDGIKNGVECATYSQGFCYSSTTSGVPDYLNPNFPYNFNNSSAQANSSAKSIITVINPGTFTPSGDSDGDGIKDSLECPAYQSGKCPDSTGTGVADYLNPNYPFKVVINNSSANNSGGNNSSTQSQIKTVVNPNTFDANGDNDGDGIKNGVECATYSQGFCYSSTTSGVPDYLNPGFPYNFNNSSAQANSSAKSIITVINPGTFTPSGDSDGDGIKDSLECPAYQSGKCPDSTGTGVADYLNPNYPFKVVVNNSSANNSGGNNSAGNSTNSANNSNNSGGNNSNFSFSNSFNNNSSANQILTDVGKTTPKGTVPVNPGNINPDGDDNNDGIKNKDQCPSYLMAYCVDADGNGVPDYLQKPKKDIIITPGTFDPEGDDNNDGIKNKDQCPAYLAGKCVDSDGNGVPDFRQTPGFTKINPTTFDPNKDSNNDGVKDGVQCATYANGYCPDTNGNKIPDYLEEKPTFIITNPGTLDPEGDDNNDGIKNGVQCPAYLSGFCPDSNGNGIPDFKDSKPTFIPQNPSSFDSNKDSNNDGIKDGVQCATFATGFCKDSDGNGIPDYLDTAKTVKSPTLYINDPYTCGGSIFGYATASGTEIDYITVTLSKNGQSSPAYTFKVNLDSAGKYNIPVQSNDSSKPFYVVESVYSVNYSVTDKAANTFSGQAYTADIKDAGKCPILPPKAPNANQETPLKKAELQLSRTGGNEFLTILLIVGSVISLAAGYFTVNKNKKTN